MAGLGAARKALVIGNASYADRPLKNPVNDADDVAAALQKAGFSVSKHTNLNREGFDAAISSFIQTLTPNDDAVVYYSGHGVQIDGVNYLIPVRENIDSIARCKYLAYNGNMLVEELKAAALSILILDACRDNPWAGTKSLSKGLASMQAAPGSQYIIFATAEGKTADDGNGRNSPFAEALVNHIKSSTKKITDMMQDVTNEVAAATHERQIPWTAGNLRRDFYFNSGALTVEAKTTASLPLQTPQAQIIVNYGSILLASNVAGDVYLDEAYQGKIPAAAQMKLSPVQTGNHRLELRAAGKSEIKYVQVDKDRESRLDFNLDFTPTGFVRVEGGTFMMGSNDGESDEKPVHQVTLSPFYMAKHELSVGEFRAFVNATGYRTNAETGGGAYIWTGSTWEKKKDANWKNPYITQTDTHPVSCVSWYDAIAYCNWMSSKEGITPCYSISGNTAPADWSKGTVVCNWAAEGYRLPTEAEWEYAARGGNKSKGYTYSGSNDIGSVAWYSVNSGSKTQAVGTKQANELGIHDMSGNVWEWCWDKYGDYPNSLQNNPTGSTSGSNIVLRGGSWGSFGGNYCRVSNRLNDYPGRSNYYYGVRVVRAIK